MSMNGLEFDPYDYYKGILKEEVNSKAEELIDNLTTKANIDIELNKKLSKETKKLKGELDFYTNKKNKFKTLDSFFKILIILGVILGVYGGLKITSGGTSSIVCLCVGIVLVILGIVLVFKVSRNNLKHFEEKVKESEDKYANSRKKAWDTLEGLRQSLNYKQFIDLVNSLDTGIKLDYEVDLKKVLTMTQEFDLNLNFGKDDSILDIYSGEVAKNPFLRILLKSMKMYEKTYTGTRLVTWTETVRDSKGNTRIVTRSQTLVATYKAPCPRYSTYSLLIYGNEAAPNLKFSRYPSGLSTNHDEKDIKNLVSRRSKDIENKAKKSVGKGKGFTALANEKFDSLFYAIDRNNETEFRLLFTPLAQQNMTELITATDTFGDDFQFFKEKKLNYIASMHSQNDISFDYERYGAYYDYEELKENYVIKMIREFNSLYFDLAPILAIPIYQMNSIPLYDGDMGNIQIVSEEAEAFVNNMDYSLFKHELTKTDQILKVNRLESYDNSDIFEVVSHSFDEIPRVTLIPTLCSNGRIYDVAVHWFEYIPLTESSNIVISKIKEDNKDNTATTKKDKNRYHDFIGSYLGNEPFSKEKDIEFANYIKKTYNKYK